MEGLKNSKQTANENSGSICSGEVLRPSNCKVYGSIVADCMHADNPEGSLPIQWGEVMQLYCNWKSWLIIVESEGN